MTHDIEVKKISELSEKEKAVLAHFLNINESKILPYQKLGFANVIDEIFGYENCSLVAFRGDMLAAYLPQWKKANIIESVPWRDKGGPVYNGDDDILEALIEKSKQLIAEKKCKAFLWRDFKCEKLEKSEYFIEVTVNLKEFIHKSYFDSVPSKVRNRLRQALAKELKFHPFEAQDTDALVRFYELFRENRKRLGVPVYPLEFFLSLSNNFSKTDMKIFEVRKAGETVSSVILFKHGSKAIYAYPASNIRAQKLNANDFMIWMLIEWCIISGVDIFHFGADSPLQESLISYKMKWRGEKHIICDSYYGDYKVSDHNRLKLAKKIIRILPGPLYNILSKKTVR